MINEKIKVNVFIFKFFINIMRRDKLKIFLNFGD